MHVCEFRDDIMLTKRSRSRRAVKSKGSAKTGAQDDGDQAQETLTSSRSSCSFEDVAPPLELLITCAMIVIAVSCARNFVGVEQLYVILPTAAARSGGAWRWISHCHVLSQC